MVEQSIKNIFLPNQNENKQDVKNRYFKNEIPNRLTDQEQKEEKNHPRVSSKKIGGFDEWSVFAAVTLKQPFLARAIFHCRINLWCNLDCHYCNEFNNSIPHPALADLKKWMDHIRKLGVARLGLQGGEPLKHPDIVEVVRYAKSLGFGKVSMSTNGFMLTRELIAALETAGLDSIHISVDRMTPIASTRKSMKSIQHKLSWFKDSKIKLNVSGVLFKETLDEMGQVVDTCLDLGVAVQARAVHDDLLHDRALRETRMQATRSSVSSRSRSNSSAVERRSTQAGTFSIIKKRCYAKNRSNGPASRATNISSFHRPASSGFAVRCDQRETFLEITKEDLLSYNEKKSCQARCGVYCTVDTSLFVNHPMRLAWAGKSRTEWRPASRRCGTA